MSTKNLLPLVGLAALGWLGFSASGAVAQGLLPGSVPDSTPRPIPAPAPAPRPSVLLLTNGRIQFGDVEDDPRRDALVVKQRGGTFEIPRHTVEYVATSLEDLYRYRAGRLPQGDADEHLKLAKWCLEHNLRLQAREQLQAILAISANHREADHMLKSMNATDELAASRVRDSAVRQAGGEMPAAPPTALEDAMINKAARTYGHSGLPTIFDLPPTIAVRRAQEFRSTIQPILQKHCVSCHNDRYPGNFRLVQMKTLREYNDGAIIRANLDAVLLLVNPENPGQSELLTRAIVPHGGNSRPVLSGPNDRNYLFLSTWANSLRSTGRPAAVAPAGNPAADPALTRTSATMPSSRPTFAIDRNGRMTAVAPPTEPEAPASFGADRAGTGGVMANNGFNAGQANVVNYEDGRYQGQGGGFPIAGPGAGLQVPPGFKPQTGGQKAPGAIDPSTVPIAAGTPARLRSMTGQVAPVPAPTTQPQPAPVVGGVTPVIPAAGPAGVPTPAITAQGIKPTDPDEPEAEAPPIPPGGYNAANLPPVADLKSMGKSSRKKKLSAAQLEALMKARNATAPTP